MSKTHFDYLIVGAGIAGTVLALQLFENGNSVKIFNKDNDSSASNVAAGIINPVTGQRFVKSWMFDELISAASSFYQHYDQLWGSSFFNSTNIHRALFSKNEVRNFENRVGDPHYDIYFAYNQDLEESIRFNAVEDWCSVKAARLDISGFIQEAKKYLIDNGCEFEDAMLEFDKLDLDSDLIEYQNDSFEKVVCCEGISIINNPYFQHLPMVPAKGECLILKISDISTKDIYKHKIFFVPLNEKNMFWVGANYDWDFTDAKPTEKGRDWLLKKVEDSLQVPFEIIQHTAAIRPTGKDRRPYLGSHPKYSDLYIFNALGTKGSSLAPYWADKLIAHMEDGVDLDPEVSITRFNPI